jgi:hypothetical protein
MNMCCEVCITIKSGPVVVAAIVDHPGGSSNSIGSRRNWGRHEVQLVPAFPIVRSRNDEIRTRQNITYQYNIICLCDMSS